MADRDGGYCRGRWGRWACLVLARAFLLVLVFAAGVSPFPSHVSAQNKNTFQYSAGTNISGVSGSITSTVGPKSITLNAVNGFVWAYYEIYACTKTATPTSNALSYLQSDCEELTNPSHPCAHPGRAVGDGFVAEFDGAHLEHGVDGPCRTARPRRQRGGHRNGDYAFDRACVIR